ncbi:hypothetical protein [Halosolutus halophilus]|uniref:hypothetical protein n=1 Tax=Halosolutus halophilus TaxID=1552990 RepID=UPI002235226F|nr:hypothetical protein [Halosolutus halophilus]
MSSFDILNLLPLGVLFVTAFAVLPIVNTVHEDGIENIDSRQWLAFTVIFIGAALLWVVSMVIGRTRFNVWPPLAVMATGFLWYMKLMRDRGELHEEPEMGGTSYE